jgi:hypothetical protein
MVFSVRLKDWWKASFWQHLFEAVLDQLGMQDCKGWCSASLDSASIPTTKTR